MHKAGFVNIIGNPNVGKSTLTNALVGERLSVINPKAQTTRHRIIGILNAPDYQVVFSDTPGIIKPAYKLQESMMKYVGSALVDADIVMYVTDPEDDKIHEPTVEKLKKIGAPLFLIINKTDTIKAPQLAALVEKWKVLFPNAKVFAVSALNKINTEQLVSAIIELLPESPAFYPKDQITDRSERFFVSEIIRGKMLKNYHKELPYSAEVNVVEFKEEDKLIRIRAEIFVERESQKAIVLGHRGSAIKKLGTDARIDIEDFLQKKVFLELFVKIQDNWRNNENILNRFGYDH